MLSRPAPALLRGSSAARLSSTFRALLVSKDGSDRKAPAVAKIVDATDDQLPSGKGSDVTVKVVYSSLNYKDGKALLGQPGVVREYPMVPGIDFVGEVESSEDGSFAAGDKVVLTGWGVGERQWGGYAEKARVPASYLVRLPPGISEHRSMVIGTAGLTAALCVMALEDRGVRGTEALPLAVTGAAGGVGSVAVALLAARGHTTVASTGREELGGYLKSLGAADVVGRVFSEAPKGPLSKQRWAGGVDSVGGQTLATLLAETNYAGAVAACGLAGGFDLPTTVMPFILRGVALEGVDSVMCPLAKRERAWQLLAESLTDEHYEAIGSRTVALGDVHAEAGRILEGRVQGRLVVDVRA